MSHLHQLLAEKVREWREDGYLLPQYPAIAEIFEWAVDQETGTLRFLRMPQLRALETYWYLRLVEGTPHIFSLHQKIFANRSDLLQALGLGAPEIIRFVLDQSSDALWERIKTDDQFVKEFRLEGVRETLRLPQLHPRARNGGRQDDTHWRDFRDRVRHGPGVLE